MAFVMEQLGDPASVLIVDETGFLKKGTKSVGVHRQYSGTAGRRENQQIGVFLAHASPRGTAFLDRTLYLPEAWTEDADRREEAGIPHAERYATKEDLAKRMLTRAFAAQVPAAWVVGDTIYGGDDPRRWLETQNRPYALAVPCCATSGARDLRIPWRPAPFGAIRLRATAWFRQRIHFPCEGGHERDSYLRERINPERGVQHSYGHLGAASPLFRRELDAMIARDRLAMIDAPGQPILRYVPREGVAGRVWLHGGGHGGRERDGAGLEPGGTQVAATF
jgi:SRSO17 transposase